MQHGAPRARDTTLCGNTIRLPHHSPYFPFRFHFGMMLAAARRCLNLNRDVVLEICLETTYHVCRTCGRARSKFANNSSVHARSRRRRRAIVAPLRASFTTYAATEERVRHLTFTVRCVNGAGGAHKHFSIRDARAAGADRRAKTARTHTAGKTPQDRSLLPTSFLKRTSLARAFLTRLGEGAVEAHN